MKNIFKKNYIATPAKNKYLGPCTMIAYKINAKMINESRCTASEILILVKTIKDPIDICLSQKKNLFKHKYFGSRRRIPLRLSSACVTGSLGDIACNCHNDSIKYLKEINSMGVGIFIYLPQEGFGRGLFAKIADHCIQNSVYTNNERDRSLTFEESAKLLYPRENYDIRRYRVVKNVFEDLGINEFPYLYLGKCGDKIKKIRKDSGLDII